MLHPFEEISRILGIDATLTFTIAACCLAFVVGTAVKALRP